MTSGCSLYHIGLQVPAAQDAHADALQVAFLGPVAVARHDAVEGKAGTDAMDG